MGKSVRIASEKGAKGAKKEEKNSAVSSASEASADVSFRIVTGSYEHNLLCVSLALFKGNEVFTPIFHFTAHTQSIRCLARSKRYLVSGSNDEHIRIYDLQKRKELGTLLHHDGSITALEFFHDKWMLSGSDDGKICVWRVKDWEVLSELKGHSGTVNDIAIHPTGRVALSVGNDKTMRLWNLMTGKKASIVRFQSVPLKVQWTADGSHIIVGFDRKVSVYSTEMELLRAFDFRHPLLHMDVIGMDTNYLVTSHGDGKIALYKMDNLINLDEDVEDPVELVGHGSRVKHFDHLHDEDSGKHYLSSVSSDGKIVVWDMSIKDQIAVYSTGDRLNCVLMFPECIERPETMRKQAGLEGTGDDTDFSASESEAEAPPPKKKQKKNKKSVSVELE